MQPLFQPFRALGYISDDVPFAVQRRSKETFVTVSVGEAWQVSSRQYWPSRICIGSLSSSQQAVGSVGVLFLQAWSEASGASGGTYSSTHVMEVVDKPLLNFAGGDAAVRAQYQGFGK